MSFLAGLAGAFGTAGGASLGSGMLSGLGQGLGSLGSSLLGGLTFGMSGSRRQMRKQQQYVLEQMKVQNQYAQEQMNLQAQLNRDQYDYEYQKESPLARVNQLKDAGLNAGLMYSGNGASGMQGSVGTVSTPSGPSGSSITGSYMQPSLGQIANLAFLESEIEKNKAQARDYDASAKGKLGETEPVRVSMDLQRAQTLAEQELANLRGKQSSYTDALRIGVEFTNQLNVDLRDYTVKTAEQKYWNLVDEGAKLYQEVVSLQFDNSLNEDKRQQLKNTLALQLADLAVKEVTVRAMNKGVELTDAQIANLNAQSAKIAVERLNEIWKTHINKAGATKAQVEANWARVNQWKDLISTTASGIAQFIPGL